MPVGKWNTMWYLLLLLYYHLIWNEVSCGWIINILLFYQYISVLMFFTRTKFEMFFQIFSVWTEYIDCYLNFNNLASFIWMLVFGILGVSIILSLFCISGTTSLVQVLIIFCLYSYKNCLFLFLCCFLLSKTLHNCWCVHLEGKSDHLVFLPKSFCSFFILFWTQVVWTWILYTLLYCVTINLSWVLILKS